MNRTWISFLIFFMFFLSQGGHCFFQRFAASPVEKGSHVVPVHYTIDQRIQPPRRYVHVTLLAPNHTFPPFLVRQIQPDGSMILKTPVPPMVALVFGRKMNWGAVTMEDLRQIPGISAHMARRLIRLRDTTDISGFSDLISYPHVGRKTIERLEKACVISHES